MSFLLTFYKCPLPFSWEDRFSFTLAFCKFTWPFAQGFLFSTYFPFASSYCFLHGKIIWFASSHIPFVSTLCLFHREKICRLCLPFVSAPCLLHGKTFFVSHLPFPSSLGLLQEEFYFQTTYLLQVPIVFCMGRF